ncbi:MAG: hypothetical protein KME09_19835 [Pleurocapsa minor HA4230-MV1]|jgi:hypothetical protein|nr:hypothetical protein [Pleurocapsa minor HA4230-MV1]
MKSAKVVNKILLISLAFGSVSVLAGMFAGESLKKALIGVGATTSVASVAGILVTSSKKKSDENQEEKQLDHRVTELDSQEGILDQSVTYQTDEMQIVETDVSSLPTEQNQLWDDPAADLNNEKQELETKYESDEQNTFGLEDHKEDLEIKNDYLNSKFENLTVENEILEQVIAPIEEQSFQETSLESETFNNSVEEIEEITENLTADINPFANSADLSEFNQSEEISALEMADKLIGTFEPTELDTSQDVPNEDSDELFMEDSDLEEEPAEELGFDDKSAIAHDEELGFESESMDFEAMPMADDDADEPIAELSMEDEQSAAEFSFDEQSESAIAPELESNPELSFESNEEMDFEAMPMADDDADEPIAELSMEDEQSAAEFSFDEQDESAIAADEELSFSESESMDFEAMPMADDDADEPIAELPMEDEQSAEFSFDEQDESAIATELESNPEFSFESESMDFEAMPMADDDADEPIAELLMEDEQSAEFSFDEQDESASATELESNPELSFESNEEMDFEAMPMEDEQSAAEFNFDEQDESASAPDEELSFSESESMDFEAMSMADDADEPIAELAMEDEQSAEFSFDEQDESASAPELESNPEFSFESNEEMDFEAMPMEDEQSAAEFSFDEQDESASAHDEELGFESESMDFEAMPMADDDVDEPIAELPMEDEQSAAEFSFDEQSESAIAPDEELSFESESMDFEAMPMEDEQSAEFSFDEQSESAIAPELESNPELSFESNEEMDFEAMPMADDDVDEPIAELPMEDEPSAEFSFDEQDESASAHDEELGLSESESMDFEAMPVADDIDEPIAELPMEDEPSAAEFSFDEQSESAIATELESNPEFSFESNEEMDFEAMPVEDNTADEPIAELLMEDEQSAEFSFDEQDESAIATELESNPELSFESNEEMDFEAMPVEDEQSAEFSFDEQDESASAHDEELGFESESMDFEAMPTDDEADELIAELPMEDEQSAEFSFDDESAIAPELESNPEFSFESESMDFEAMPMADDADESIAELLMEDEQLAEFSFDEQDESAIASELESNQELSFDDESEISSESDDMDFEAMSMADTADDEPMAELVMEDESSAEFSFDEQSAMSSESEEIDFEAIPMADSDFDNFMGELVVDDQSAIATELESNQELGFDAQSEISSESDEMDFEAMLMVDDESDRSAVEFSFEDSSAIASKADEFMGQFIDEDDSVEEMSSESDEFSFNVVESLNLDAEAFEASESDEFMKELVDDNELAFESEEDVAIADNYDSDEFMAAFSDADKSPQEFSFEETSTDDSEFNELMGAFSDDSQSSDDELNADSDAFKVKFEDDEENYDLDELDSLDAIDKKLDELTEISDDSLGELNDLLGSIQDNTSVKEELNEINREK